MSQLLAAAGTLQLGQLDPPTAVFSPGAGAVGVGTPIALFISNIIGFVTGLAGIMFLIYLIFAGLSWITAGGDKGKVEAARNQMTQAALGLVVVIAAYSIAGVVGRVLGIDLLDPVKMIGTILPR